MRFSGGVAEAYLGKATGTLPRQPVGLNTTEDAVSEPKGSRQLTAGVKKVIRRWVSLVRAREKTLSLSSVKYQDQP